MAVLLINSGPTIPPYGSQREADDPSLLPSPFFNNDYLNIFSINFLSMFITMNFILVSDICWQKILREKQEIF